MGRDYRGGVIDREPVAVALRVAVHYPNAIFATGIDLSGPR